MKEITRPVVCVVVLALALAGCASAGSKGEAGATQTQAVLVPAGSVWNYDDTGTDLGTEWRTGAFSAISGTAQLGYGDGDVVTVIDYGPDESNKHPTYYFRRSFTIANPKDVAALKLKLIRDDGAVAYINGQEVARSNMPGGEITYHTWVREHVPSAEESIWHSYKIPTSVLVRGENVIAVEVHQAHGASSDVSFDLELIQNPR